MFRGRGEENCGPHPTPHTLIKIVAQFPLFLRRQLAGVTGVKSGWEKMNKRAEFSLSCSPHPPLHSTCIMFMTSTLLHLMKSHVTSVRSFLQQLQEITECSLPGRRQKKGREGRGGGEKREEKKGRSTQATQRDEKHNTWKDNLSHRLYGQSD